jgi:hypothetical protein
MEPCTWSCCFGTVRYPHAPLASSLHCCCLVLPTTTQAVIQEVGELPDTSKLRMLVDHVTPERPFFLYKAAQVAEDVEGDVPTLCGEWGARVDGGGEGQGRDGKGLRSTQGLMHPTCGVVSTGVWSIAVLHPMLWLWCCPASMLMHQPAVCCHQAVVGHTCTHLHTHTRTMAWLPDTLWPV